jgi:rubrerythrin
MVTVRSPEVVSDADAEDAAAIQRMLDDGAPVARRRRLPRITSPLQLAEEPSAEERAAQRRAARRLFRLYCLACGRSTESSSAPARAGRCPDCGGTMLWELAAD